MCNDPEHEMYDPTPIVPYVEDHPGINTTDLYALAYADGIENQGVRVAVASAKRLIHIKVHGLTRKHYPGPNPRWAKKKAEREEEEERPWGSCGCYNKNREPGTTICELGHTLP